MILDRHFYHRPTLEVAKELLGKFLVIEKGGQRTAHMIREVEAYDGPSDRASHAYRGRTERTKVMFGPGGHWYVYLVYGMHWMLNVVTGPQDYPAAILIRGAGDFGKPAVLTKALGIDKAFNGKPASQQTGLWIEDRGVQTARIQKTPRIGVDYAGRIWSKKPYRFLGFTASP